jgi:hypothetical protein
MAPPNQSRLSDEDGPPHWFCTASVRAGQRERDSATPSSNCAWHVSENVLVNCRDIGEIEMYLMLVVTVQRFVPLQPMPWLQK